MKTKAKKRKKNTDLEFLVDVQQHHSTAYALRKKYHLTESRMKKKLKAIGYVYVGNGRGQPARAELEKKLYA